VHDAAERRLLDAPNRSYAARHDGDDEIMMGERQAQAVADDALHLVLAAGEIDSPEYRLIEELGEVKRRRRKVDVPATPQNVHAYCTRRTRLASRGEDKIQRFRYRKRYFAAARAALKVRNIHAAETLRWLVASPCRCLTNPPQQKVEG
jgi:hypothetical protein